MRKMEKKRKQNNDEREIKNNRLVVESKSR